MTKTFTETNQTMTEAWGHSDIRPLNVIDHAVRYVSTSLLHIFKINAQKNSQELFTAEADLSKVIFSSTAPETLKMPFITHSQGLNKISRKATWCLIVMYSNVWFNNANVGDIEKLLLSIFSAPQYCYPFYKSIYPPYLRGFSI